MAVSIYSEEIRRARSLAMQVGYTGWVAEQLAAGLDGPTPPDRKEPSDYSQHVPLMEADGLALDLLFDLLVDV